MVHVAMRWFVGWLVGHLLFVALCILVAVCCYLLASTLVRSTGVGLARLNMQHVTCHALDRGQSFTTLFILECRHRHRRGIVGIVYTCLHLTSLADLLTC